MSQQHFANTCQVCGTRIGKDAWLCADCREDDDTDADDFNPDACPECGSDEAGAVICSECGHILVDDDD
ncbi:hypothetical protein K3G63_11025 [Hymenobacter sp. HSC-4F20]|uniref:hypothetical protein n=1 Tax=Hymenobacter sp. HSC-4F20 TaxID=2864135 RepID=UPI001C738ADA|nr:hypothetical protein [Hymenobacter sp. HSC-4F20]MBX0290975.1 hypothetical protein [Hymenobacter sp. HSC-4F20]